MNFIKIYCNLGYYNFYRDGNHFYVLHTNKERTRTLNENEIKELLQYIFSSDVTYSHDEYPYKIYIDENNNKRFFKNGKEDLLMFIQKNGKTAIQYNEGTNSDELVKLITLKIKKKMITMLLVVTETATLLSGALAVNTTIAYNKPYQVINLEEAIALIENSRSLPDEYNQFFENEELIQDILKYASLERSEELRKRLTNFGILYFTKDELENLPADTNGYYNSLKNCNKIHLRDGSVLIFLEVAPHEYIHLFQSLGEYNYIFEPCAEIMSHEYFERNRWVYKEQVYNLALLMEVIGPEPILECCFATNQEPLENEIGKYLNEADKNSLLEELKKEVGTADDNKIKNYIRKMIKTKRERNPELEYLNENLNGSERLGKSYYFNTHSEKYSNESTSYEEIVEDININNIMELQIYHHETLSTTILSKPDDIKSELEDLKEKGTSLRFKNKDGRDGILYYSDNTLKASYREERKMPSIRNLFGSPKELNDMLEDPLKPQNENGKIL